MSVQNVMSFWKRVQDDPVLQEKLKAELPPGDREAALRHVMRVAAEGGLSFTVDDYEAARREIPALLAGEVPETVGFGAGQLVGLGGALAPGGVLRSGGVLRTSDLGCTSGLFARRRR